MALLYNREARNGWSSSYTSSDGMDVNMSGWTQQETPAPSSTGLNPPTAPVLSNLPPSTSAGYGGTTTTTAEAQSGTPPARSSSSSPGGYQTAYNNMPSTSSSPQQGDGNGHRSSYWGGMGSGIMLAVIVVLFALLFLCLRRRRRRRRQEYLTRENKDSEEGGTVTPTSTQHSVSSVTPLRPAVIAPYSLSQQQEPPIILSSIDPSRNNTYFTGLDTSDVMSVRSTGTRTTNMDEPPPPYRPRSIAIALSRDSSVRHPPQPNHGANHGLSASQDDSRPPIRSPFADPADDSLSEISEPSQGAPRRIAEDEYSAVSDLSYQRDGPAGGSLGRR